MLKDKIKYCFDYGKSAEKRFAEKHMTNIVYSNKNQDIYEHWDVMGLLKEIGKSDFIFSIFESIVVYSIFVDSVGLRIFGINIGILEFDSLFISVITFDTLSK